MEIPRDFYTIYLTDESERCLFMETLEMDHLKDILDYARKSDSQMYEDIKDSIFEEIANRRNQKINKII